MENGAMLRRLTYFRVFKKVVTLYKFFSFFLPAVLKLGSSIVM